MAFNLSSLLPIATTIGGGLVGGPAGAALGASLGGALAPGQKPSGGSGGTVGGYGMPQNTDQDLKNDIKIENNVVGAPISINVGGSQQVDGSLGAGQKYNDRGVDEQGIAAPFGTMQDVRSSTRSMPVDFNDLFFNRPAGRSFNFLWIGGGLVLAGGAFALLKARHAHA